MVSDETVDLGLSHSKKHEAPYLTSGSYSMRLGPWNEGLLVNWH